MAEIAWRLPWLVVRFRAMGETTADMCDDTVGTLPLASLSPNQTEPMRALELLARG